MKKQIHKRMLAWMLTFAMVSSMFTGTAFAEEASKSAECTHSHDETCGYMEAVDEIPCNQECTDTDGDGLIDHAEECTYTLAAEGQPCTHVNDESCGGVVVEQPEKETEAAAENTADDESLPNLIELLRELPEPKDYLEDGTANESILDRNQLAKARAAVDNWLAEEEKASSGSAQELEQLQSLILRLKGLEHIRDTETDCLDVDCPYHYPEIIREQMAQDETPKLLTLDDLVEDYGVEPPMQTFGRLRSASVPHPQTLMLSADNENNSHTGSSDGDIDVLLSNTKGTHPIELSFTLDALPTHSAYLAVKAYDVDEDSGETDYVYINDDIFLPKDKTNSYGRSYHDSTIGYLSGTNATWNTTILRIPLEKLKVGKNTISITIASGWVVKVDWMQLVLDGGAEDNNIQEFSLKLEDSAASGNNVTVQASVTFIQTGNVEYTTEYTLTQNETGNALDACFGTVSASETIELALPLNSPTGIYTITGLLKDSATEEIKATDSISFYFTQGQGLGPKISHTLTPDSLTNQSVTITVSAQAIPEAGITVVDISENEKTVSANGAYSFTVNYTLNGNSQSVIYPVKVDTIDKQAPVIKYSTISVLQDEAYDTVKKLFADALSASDNRELAGEPLSYTIPQDISKTGGEKTIAVTATDAAGNTATQDCTITVMAKPVKLTMNAPAPVSGIKDSYALTAVLDNGSDQITETGFIWGVMPNPTLALNNGSVTTASVVKATGETLTGTATELVSGVEYYARAYAKVTENNDTNVVYSEAKQFGFGIPSYGTFSVSSVSKNTFTIERTGGTDGAQTVYYRTVNGSAIGGTHFTHLADMLMFADGETSKTVTVEELGVTSAYNSDEGTQYSNADRTYSLEIYRVEGGGAIDQNNRAKTRTMTKNSDYTIDRSFYNDLKQNGDVAQQQKHIVDRTSDQGASDNSVNFTDVNREGNNNWYRKIGVASLYSNSVASYLNATNGYWLYRFAITGHGTDNKGYQDVWFGYQQPPAGDQTLNGATTPSSLTGQIWFDIFDFNKSGCKAKVLGNTSLVQSINTEQDAYSTVDPKGYAKNDSLVVSYNGSNYGKLEVTQDAWVCFSAHGNDKDDWYIIRYQEEAILQDANEPTLLGVAPMAGGTYLPGDPITVALVFDEIVDSQNSNLSKSDTITTNVGTLTYAGGADTNVLYFTGNVASNTGNLSGDNALQVTGISNAGAIQDMCSTAGTTSTATTGSSNVIVDATKPTVEITFAGDDAGNVLPRHQATITATNASTLQYAWTKSTDLPAYGWSNVASGTQLTESRGTAGATETWYLHVLATSSSGATTHTYQSFTFQQPNITAVSVRAGESSDSANVAEVWKPSKYIVVTYAGAQTSGTTLTFAGPQTGSQTLSSNNGTVALQVTKNGIYTITLTDGYGSVISKTIEVTKIDADTPTVTLRSGNSTDGNTVYNSLSIAVLPEDKGGSGLAKVEYAWTNTATAPSTWSTLTASDGSYQAAYTATETAKTAKYLHVQVTDGAGNVSDVVTSGPYQVIQPATGEALPSITVNGNPITWTKSATLTWTATEGNANIQTVYTPDGAVTGSLNGNCIVTKNGVYTFVVMDANGNSASAEVNVTWVDSEAPKLTSLTAQADKTNGTIALAGVTDNCTVIYDNKGNYSSISGSGIKTRQYRLESESSWTTFTGDSITVTENGTYIIKLTDNLDNSREYSVKMEGIDAVKPSISISADGYLAGDNGWWRNNSSGQVNLAVTYFDNVSVTELWVQIDNGAFTQITSFDPRGTFSYTDLQEGEHTYTFKAVDAAGNENTASMTVKLDTGKPEIGTITCEQKAANFLDWIIGKDSLIIHIPVTDNTSGAKTLTYTETPSGGTAETKTITLSGTAGTQTADVTLNADWKGTITDITCTDTAGNVSDAKGIEGAGNGIIVENNAPEITILADRGIADASSTSQSGTELSGEYYNSAPNLLVTVKDDVNNAVTGGLKSVTWKLGDGTVQNVGVNFQSSMKAEYSFTISALQGKTGSVTVTVTTEDHAGNTANETVTVLVKAKEPTPSPSVDYQQEKLTNLVPGAAYGIIPGYNIDPITKTADAQGYIAIEENWFGREIQIFKYGGTNTLDSEKASVRIAYRPWYPSSVTKTNETIKGKKDGKLTGVSTSMEYSVDGGSNWISITESNITGLGAGEIWIRYKATADAPHGEATTLTIKEGRTLTVTFESNGVSNVSPITGKSWNDIVDKPENPVKEGYTFEGWYRENTFETIWNFTSDKLTGDVTLYAKWTLTTPSVTLTAVGGTTDANSGAVSAVYNNGNTVITLKAELNKFSDINYTYAWFKDSVKLADTGESLTLKTVNQSGSYKVELTAVGAGQTATKASGEITVSIVKATPVVTEKPTAFGITYGDSLAQSSFTGGEAKVASTTVEGSFAWAASGSMPAVSDSNTTSYTVVFTPEDTANYNSITTECTLTVNKKALTPSVASVNNKTYDQTVAASGTVSLAGAVFGQQPEATGTFAFTNANAGQNKQVDVTGIALSGNWGDNYILSTTSLKSQTTTAEITPRTVGLSWNGDTGLVYSGKPANVTATATGVLAGDKCEVTVTGGTETDAGTHTATPSLTNQNYCLPQATTHSYTIEKAPITFLVSDNKLTYDGTAKNATVKQTEGETPRIDAAGYTVSYEKGDVTAMTATDAGTYNVIVTLTDNNYRHAKQETSDKETVGVLTVEKKPVTAVWTNLTAVYNGTAQAPKCSTLVGLMEVDAGQDDAGRKYVSADFTQEQQLTDAGTKRLTAALAGARADNYRLTNPSVNFTVQKAPVTFEVTDNFVKADGNAHKATVSAYANMAALDAGKYIITYRNAAGKTVEEPADAASYAIYAKLKDSNYRHSGTADGAAYQIGVLTIYRSQTQTANTYTVGYAAGAEDTSEVTGALPAEQTGLSEGTLIYLPGKGTLSRTGHAFTGWLLNGKLYQPGETFTMPAKNVTITACWKEAAYCISGVVDQESNPLQHAVVTLKRGSEIVGETTTDALGNYSFKAVIPGLYNLVTSYNGITTTVKVLIVDADAEQKVTLPAGRTNSILEVAPGAPAVIVGNLEKLLQTAGGTPVYSEIYTADEKTLVEAGGTVEIKLTVEQVTEPDSTGAELLKEAMQKLPADFNYQPELYLNLVLRKSVYPANSSVSTTTTTLSDSNAILESVVSLPFNLQNRKLYKVYRTHEDESGDTVLEELAERPNTLGEYFELNPESTELTIHARKYSVYTIVASDYVAPKPAEPETSKGTKDYPDIELPEETIRLPEEEKKVENSQIYEKPLEEENKSPAVNPEDTLPEQERWEEAIPAGRNGKSFVVLNVLLTLFSIVMAVLLLPGRRERRRKIVGLSAAAASLLSLLLTIGFAGVRIADIRTILFALLAAITVFMNLTGTKQNKEE